MSRPSHEHPHSSKPPRKPRLAILGSRGIPARYGGFETFAEELSARLVEAGFDVTVFCPEGGPRPDEHRGVKLEYCRGYGSGALATVSHDLACLWRARKEYDVVYMLGYGTSPFCLIPRLWGTDVWINMDGLEWKRSKWNRLVRTWLRFAEAAALRVASRVIFDSQAVSDQVRASHAHKAESSVIEYGSTVAEGAKLEALSRFGLEPDNYFLAVCRFEPENHVAEIIRGHAESQCDRPLVIVTNTEHGTRYAKATLQLSSDRARFIGGIYDREVLTTLRKNCFAYLHGHSVGGTNPSLLEAMGCGNLVISHDNPYCREVLGDDGLYFGSQGELRERLEQSEAMQSDERTGFGTRCQTRVSEYYSWDRIVRSYIELLDGTTPTDTRVRHERAA